jgi:predicted aspartyl protease
MESTTMGRVVIEAKIENFGDIWAVMQGIQTADQIRSVTVPEALVDTDATFLSLSPDLIQKLGLAKFFTRRVRSSAGATEAAVYGAVRLTIQGRSCIVDLIEAPEHIPVLIGQIPLEHLDLVIDLRNRTLIDNPAHGGEHIYELY